MGKYITIDGVLYHTDNIAYIDLDPDEIMHWKYIKREKLANGKYRYYYDQSSLDTKKKATNDAQAERNAAKDDYEFAKNKLDLIETHTGKAYVYGHRNGMTIPIVTGAPGEKLIAQIEKDAAKKEYKEASVKATKLTAKYATEKVIGLPLRAISKGFVALANLFSGANKNKGMETAANVKARGTNKKRIGNNYKNYLEERTKIKSTTKRRQSTAKKTVNRRG